MGGMPKRHDISFLLNQVKNIKNQKKGLQIKRDLLLCADKLTKYSVAPRYPNEIEVDEEQLRKALSDSENILLWVENVIAAPFLEYSDNESTT